MHFLIYIGILLIVLGAIGSYYNNDERLKSVVKFYKLIKFFKEQNIFITLIGTVLIIIGGQIDGNKSKEDIKQNDNFNTEKILSVLDLVLKDDFTGALHVFNAGNLQVKKGVIQELKNKAIHNIDERQKILTFLTSLNDWVDNYPELKDKDFQWTAWLLNKELIEVNDTILCKENQLISIEVSMVINEIVDYHAKQKTNLVLNFWNQNVIALKPTDVDFKYGNINLSKANLYGCYFIGCESIEKTDFLWAKFYGSSVFCDCYIPKKLNELGEFGTEYNGNLTFKDVRFLQGLSIVNTRIKGDLSFLNCEFYDDVNLNMVKFDNELRFNRGIFNKKVSFNASHFGADSYFFYSDFKSSAQFVTVTIEKQLDFKGCTFNQKPNFKGSDTKKIINLKK